MGTVDDATAAQLDYLSRALVNQLLHTPTVKMKEKSREADGVTYAAMLCEFFDLDIPLPHADSHSAQSMGHESDTSFDLSWFVAVEQEGSQVCSCALMPLNGSSTDLACHSEISNTQYELVGQP